MRIQNNIMAMNTHRQLGINNLNQTKSTEKLSSGYRINRAADDAAGLMISEKMRSQIRGLNQASANAQDGISLIQAAEGALQETHSILQRMRELAVKGANDVLEDVDRQAVDAEMKQLAAEVDRIAFTTEFNKKTLLDGSLQDGAMAAKTISGFGVSTGITATSDVATGTHTIGVTQAGARWNVTYDVKVASGDLEEGDIVNFKIQDGVNAGTDVDVFTYKATGNADVDSRAITNGLKAALDKQYGERYNITSEGSKITITAKEVGDLNTANLTAIYGATGLSALSAATVAASDPTGATEATYTTSITTMATAATANDGVDAEIAVDGDKTITSGDVTYANGIYTAALDNGTLTFRMNDVTQMSSAVINVQTGRALTLQVGANTGSDQTIGVSVRSLSAAGLGIDFLDVSTHNAAQASIDSIEKAITTVSEQRSALGAVQNRLEHTVANLDTVSENLQAAESRIRDVDMAKEMMNFTKNNILQQAATAMLAQANQAPQTVLQLLR